MAATPSRKRPAPCPECGEPTNLGGRFCRACGWDAELDDTEDSYLDGVDLPQGYGPDEPPPRARVSPVGVLLALLALGGFVAVFVLGR